MKIRTHPRPRVAGGGYAASVASLMLGIILPDRRDARAEECEDGGEMPFGGGGYAASESSLALDSLRVYP